MNQGPDLTQILTALTSQLPMLLICLVGAIVALTKWPQAPRASLWVLLGCLLGVLVSILAPVVQILSVEWMRGMAMSQRAPLFTGISLFWSLLRAVSFLFLIIGVYAGHRETAAAAQAGYYPPQSLPPGMTTPPPPGFR